MQSIRSVLTPETADSEYAIRTKINELQKEKKDLIARALAENDDGKYDFQFARIKQELEQLQAQLEGVQAVQKGPGGGRGSDCRDRRPTGEIQGKRPLL